MPWELKHAVELLLLPPGHSLLLWLLALVLMVRGRPFGAAVTALAGVVSVVVFSLPVTAGALLRALQPEPVSVIAVHDWKPEAVVVLGGGRRSYAPEYAREEGDTLGRHTLERVRFAAVLRRSLEVPLLVTGGRVLPEGSAEAVMMADALRAEFGVDVRWVEDRSRNTAENAWFTARLLKADGIERIALVTSATHMPRAVAVFESTGLAVLPVPTAFDTGPVADLGVLDFLPGAESLAGSARALHEWLGLAWYRLRGVI